MKSNKFENNEQIIREVNLAIKQAYFESIFVKLILVSKEAEFYVE